MPIQTLNDQREPFYKVTATDLNRWQQTINALNGRTKVYLPPGAWVAIGSGSGRPSLVPVTDDEYVVEFPAASGGQLIATLPSFWDLQYLATDTIDVLLDWELPATSVSGSFAWHLAPRIRRPGIPTDEDLPTLDPPIEVEVGALTAKQRYTTTITIPFAGGDSIASILGTTPTGYDSTIGGAWLARLKENDSIKLILTKAAPGSGSNVNQPVRLIEARARIGTTVDAADAMPYRIRNVTVTGGTARAAPNQLTFDVSSGSFTLNWDAPLTPPNVGGYQIAENGATFPDPTSSSIQSGRAYVKTGVSVGTHTYDVRAVGASPNYLPSTLARTGDGGTVVSMYAITDTSPDVRCECGVMLHAPPQKRHGAHRAIMRECTACGAWTRFSLPASILRESKVRS